MEKKVLIQSLHSKFIVSCQALKNEPLYGAETMAKLALAAQLGGASAIRANTPEDIKAIKSTVDIPIIGLYKKDYEDSEIYITPTIAEVDKIVEAGADIIACDCTNRVRPNGIYLAEFIKDVKKKYPNIPIMADISTEEEGIKASELGVDIVSTTLSGYTPYSPQLDTPDFQLIERLSSLLTIPVIAEGRIAYPNEAEKALLLGAYAVIVGGAITRPMEITKRFVSHIQKAVEEKENMKRA